MNSLGIEIGAIGCKAVEFNVGGESLLPPITNIRCFLCSQAGWK